MNVSTAEQHIWKNSFRKFFHKYKHGLLQLYFLIYFPWFHWLEKTVTSHFHTIHMEIDDMIPFIEYFIVPYFLWFAYVAFAIFYFFFKNKSEYYRLCAFLFIGMTVFLIISTETGFCVLSGVRTYRILPNILIPCMKWISEKSATKGGKFS